MKKTIIAMSVGILILAAVLILVPDGSSQHTENTLPSTSDNSAPRVTRPPAEAYLSPMTEPQTTSTDPTTEEPPVFLSAVHEDVFTHNAAALECYVDIPQSAVMQYICADENEEEIQSTLAHIKALSDDICSGIDSDYDKLFALAQWVSENFYYDYDARNTSVTQETIALCNVLENRRTVCMGFANLYAALCCAQGIDCRVAHGTCVPAGTFDDDITGELHEWNVAYINGEHIWVDTLWNTTHAYRDGTYIDGKQHTRYFDMSDCDIAKNHRADRIEVRDYFSLSD